MRSLVVLFATGILTAQTQVKPVVSQRSLSEQANIVRLAPHFTCTDSWRSSRVMLARQRKFI